MKKITFLSVFAIALACVSCKKDRTCSCTYANGDSAGSVVIHDTKSKAKTACDLNNNSSAGITCALK